MYRAFIIFLLFLQIVPVYATRTVVTQSPVYNPYYTPHAYYGGDYVPNSRYHRRHSSIFPDINDLEKYAMNKNFTGDSDRVRLERLETLAFGAVQEGDIYNRYDNVRNAILTRPKQNTKTSILRGISNYLNGQLTGYTPSIMSGTNSNSNLYPYSSGYSSSSSTEYITPWGKGYRTNNYGIGSGSGVHILD